MTKKQLIHEIARQLYLFNWVNKRHKVSDEFEVDGKKYSVKKEVYSFLKDEGYVSLVRLMET